jgi:hypothetical protein
MYASQLSRLQALENASAQLTTGLRWAPETEPTPRMMAISAAPAAIAFSRSARRVSVGLSGDPRSDNRDQQQDGANELGEHAAE